MINASCKGALGQLLNHFLPTQKITGKRREGTKIIQEYGTPQTPYSRVMAAPEVSDQVKKELQAIHGTLNPLALGRQVEQEKREIERCRILCA